ncbi:4'-phosphopantetheinyl transferase [Richelia sinica FACHB-800]|uniref:4'-phosphopantetheinyl transferase n=1 Tax=Richelia sinica FACHB-800 TaxID=1357546 RepID=A0A975TCG8_9NOST|nr:4'-phosphopantetheinyl transferase HetI [Richelia sinica]MBD2667010.1 4'-phosphopantetheinyl transferase superfamily protein [Richelia sinica FACHB-800]QXE25478.1 4'-phosphopantetheinyl transferase [Richelia sinica FACHB-800]
MNVCHWLTPPIDLNLPTEHVHIWRIHLNQPESIVLKYRETLSSDEITRAERFYFPEHRQQFIVGRGSLRNILGRYLGVSPSAVEFDYQPRGKPFLADKFAVSGLRFNLSHSQDLALCGVSYQQPIGVDLEYMRQLSDLESLAKRFFLPAEYELVASLPPEQKQQVFFRYWTCKESYLKATGDGLVQLEQVAISLTNLDPAKLGVPGEWSLEELVPADNFAAAVAVAGQIINLQCWQYENIE